MLLAYHSTIIAAQVYTYHSVSCSHAYTHTHRLTRTWWHFTVHWREYTVTITRSATTATSNLPRWRYYLCSNWPKV